MNYENCRTVEMLSAAKARTAKIEAETGQRQRPPLEARAIQSILLQNAIARLCGDILVSNHPLAKTLREQFTQTMCILDPELFIDNMDVFLRIQSVYKQDLADFLRSKGLL